jgi:ABC-type lipoprotein release transport system permease subunit
MLRAAAVAGIGGLLGVGVAYALSGLFPVGFVRPGEPDPGLDLNLAFLAGGLAIALVVILAAVAFPAWRNTSARDARSTSIRRSSRLATWLRGAGASPAAVAGVHFALEPASRGRSSGLRASILGGALVTALLAGALTFSASLRHLVDTPRLYGWNWDVMTDVTNVPDPVSAALDDHPQVARWATITNSRLDLEGQPVPALGITPGPEGVAPTIVRGRQPETEDEIALGGRTMHRFDVDIGDTITATAGDDRELAIVGQAVFPGLGTYSGSERTELGIGAVLTKRALRELGPALDSANTAIVGTADSDPDALVADIDPVLAEAHGELDDYLIDAEPQRPTDIVALDEVQSTQLVLAGLLAALVLAQLVIAMLTATRRQRHDLAVLRTTGFVRRQMAAVVTWQMATISAIALVIGLPLGIALGRYLWTELAERLGALPQATTPTALLLLLAAAGLGLAAVLAVVIGVGVSRTRPAQILRTE